MKDILSIWLYQTLLILVLKHITICHANDPSESYDLDRNYYEERSSNNRRGYKEPDNISRVNQIYEAAYADRARRLRQQNYIGRVGDSKFTKPENLRQPLNPDSQYNLRSAYPTNPGYGNTRNGDSSENIDIASAGTSSIEADASDVSVIKEISHANNTMFTSSIAKPSADSCSCQGTGASDEVSFLCFSSKEGSKGFSIKSKGITKFNLEDIIKAYKFYYDNIKVHNFNFENIINGESNFHHEFEGDNKFNVDVSKFKINGFNEGNFNFEAESKFDINEIKNGANKFKVNTFDKFDMNTVKKDSNKINFDVTKNGIDIHKYFNDNNKFNTQFDKNINGNFNLETNSKMEAFKNIQSMTESNKNSKFYFNNDLNVNQNSFDFDLEADAQAEIEAHAKALAQAKAIAKAEAILQAQAKAQAEAKAKSVIQSQMIAQAQADAQAQAMIQTQANSQYKIQTQGQGQAHAQAQAYAQAQAQSQAQAQAQSQAQAQAHAQAQSQAQAQAQAQAHAQAQAQAHSNVQAYNQGQMNSQAQSFGFNKGFNFGIGGEKTIFGNGGYSLGIGGFGGKITGGIGKSFGATWGSGNGGTSGAVGGIVPISGLVAVGDDGIGTSAAVSGAYTGDEFNYPDGVYDDNLDDGYTSVGYPGVIAYPAPIDSPITGNHFNGDGHNHKDLDFTPYGSSYARYP